LLLIKDHRDAIFQFVNIAQGEEFVKSPGWISANIGSWQNQEYPVFWNCWQ